jgi:cellulose synthase/poly-beta-1,6-N-acetylglucosamine synthase-like glycosyltransferase
MARRVFLEIPRSITSNMYTIILLFAYLAYVALVILHGAFHKAPEELHGPPQVGVSVLIPFYNEKKNIMSTIQSILESTQALCQIILVNDGSTDWGEALVIGKFKLRRTGNREYRRYVDSNREILLVDKENEGKARALNAGLGFSKYDLICVVDADTVLERDCLERLTKPFLSDARTQITFGRLAVRNNLDGNPIKRLTIKLQKLEYLRLFLFERLFWSRMNASLVAAGTCVM